MSIAGPGTARYRVRVVHYPTGEPKHVLGTVTLPYGVPCPRSGETVEVLGLTLLVFAVLWDLDHTDGDDTTLVELRCR